jgi:hypothetical protein
MSKAKRDVSHSGTGRWVLLSVVVVATIALAISPSRGLASVGELSSLPQVSALDSGSLASKPANAATRSRVAACRHVPKLIGLSLSVARTRSAQAGCKLRVREAGTGQVVEEPPYGPSAAQIITRQTPHAGSVGRIVTVWLKPLCDQSAEPGPPAHEPSVKRGPTELVSGLFLDGGPLRHAARCRSGTPSPGTITVTSQTGMVIASDKVATGQLARIRLAPGTYTVHGTFADATSNGQSIEAEPQTVTIAAGETVREDVVANIP